jgi:signal transduction histidine kinase
MSTTSSLVDRLAALPTLAAIPRAQLEWLAAHGQLRQYPTGAVMFAKGQPSPDTSVVLSGRFSIRVERGGIVRRTKQWSPGDISGRLPYSRMTNVPGDVSAEEPVELLAIPDMHEAEMIRECYEFTAMCVHEMLDRARQFKSDDLQSEKMASLGRLSAGLAHELNNPSSAVARSAKELAICRRELAVASRELGTACLGPDQLAAVNALDEAAAAAMSAEQRAPLARADREDSIAEWLDANDLDNSLAEPLADSALTLADLERAASGLTPEALPLALRFIAADVTARRLTTEIETAANRIHSLVAAIKTFTRMDRAPVLEPVNLEETLGQLLTLFRTKARGKNVTVELEVKPGLPEVQGFGGELNQVWSNLLDNAIDAAPQDGRVLIVAASRGDSVEITFIDNGAGIPPEIQERIFEPFYTTKGPGIGSGMGLDIALGVVHHHRGIMEFTSRPGRTEFLVRLPAAMSAAAPRS